MTNLVDAAIRIVDDAAQKRDRAAVDNSALQRCSLEAAVEIVMLFWDRTVTDPKARVTAPEVAAIIYKAMRNGREL